MNRFFTLAIIIILTLPAMAQHQVTDFGVKCNMKTIDLEVQFYSPSVVRIVKLPQGRISAKKSLSVIKGPVKKVFTLKTDGQLVKLRTDSLQVYIDQKEGTVTFLDVRGIVLLTEKANGAEFTPFDDAGDQTFSAGQKFLLDKDEHLYGLGQHQNGKMSQRNQTVNLVQGNTEDAITFFQSTKGYGIFWDNYSPTTFTDNAEATSFKSEVAECIDYYFMYGKRSDGVIRGMRELTGQVPMFPLWTYGFWQSKERYKTQDELVGVVSKYRELGVPLDGVIQDWQYWGSNYLWNAMDFLNPDFYDPRKMVDDIHQNNAHLIISIWSSFGPHTKPYEELAKKNMLLDFSTWPQSGCEKFPVKLEYPSGVRVYDAFNPDARDIYWKFLSAGILPSGIDGWWMDSTEPDHLDAKPADMDNRTYLGSYRKVCNAYPLMTVGGVYTHHRAASSDKRVFILTRSAFAGQQRYGANTWSGDVVASWPALANQITAGLNFSLCGIPHWNSDIGGFFLWNFPKGIKDPEYRELYVRWLQFGTFCPMMRSHGTDAPREIYQFGKKGDRAYDAIEKYIRLRYRLLPYIYSNSWDVTANHSSFMRALMMDFPHDKEVLDIGDQYMFGKSILVNPVTTPMYVKKQEGTKELPSEDFTVTKSRPVYLPKGVDWYDFWTGEKVSGGKKIERETPFDIIPLYVKAGSIIPMGRDVQYATEKKWDNLDIYVYEGANGTFTLYEDENDNYNYETGKYSTITFQWNDVKKILTIGERTGAFNGMPAKRTFNVVRISPGKNAVTGTGTSVQYDKVVSYDGHKVNVKL